ncbi:Gfo/Idh/MocA family protein [Paenibacillus sp. J2TS4]|uniref:Gfo/Idh/MocA family protein n=1 Tax=Paenibacillus sp. J2TS4 TaxID=2807194 RepID=UPI001B097B98|nr:Gfo/Idh/MocA family oxidoreductase [Paenibacillus sp. J2TS4]GIP33296.1 oxidoreductase [Paenibacillus sp. J2TS4]
MKAILIGLGVAGFGWFKKLSNDYGLQVAVVESDVKMKSKLEGLEDVPFYTSLREAIEQERPDFIVNVTPPHVHTEMNHIALDYGLPILCEKPIAFDYVESIGIVKRAAEENIPFMVAENYRHFAPVRKLKQLLEEGAIGALSAVDVSFYRYHHRERSYPASLLKDIAVHHFDMMRFLTGREGKVLFAKNYNPAGSWDAELYSVNLYAWLEMEGGLPISYTGSMTARGRQTEWCGDWRLEGTEGAIELSDKKLTLTQAGTTSVIDDFSDIAPYGCLDEFLASLRENREAVTSGRDYLKTQALVHYVEESCKAGRLVDIRLPEL